MRATEFITEAREGSLYHWTPIDFFKEILSSNTLKPSENHREKTGKPYVSLTRDMNYSTTPRSIHSMGVGFRLDQNKLHRAVGKKLKPHGPAEKALSAEQFFKTLDADTEQKAREQYAEIKRKLANGEEVPDHSFTNGMSLLRLSKGTAIPKSKWEHEERIIGGIPNLSQYLTGIVLIARRKAQADDIVGVLKYLVRNLNTRVISVEEFLKVASEANVPLVMHGHDFSPKEALQEYNRRKNLPSDEPDYKEYSDEFYKLFGKMQLRQMFR